MPREQPFVDTTEKKSMDVSSLQLWAYVASGYEQNQYDSLPLDVKFRSGNFTTPMQIIGVDGTVIGYCDPISLMLARFKWNRRWFTSSKWRFGAQSSLAKIPVRDQAGLVINRTSRWKQDVASGAHRDLGPISLCRDPDNPRITSPGGHILIAMTTIWKDSERENPPPGCPAVSGLYLSKIYVQPGLSELVVKELLLAMLSFAPTDVPLLTQDGQ